MSELNLDNIVGFKAVDKDGNEQNVTVDEMVDMVATRMVSALSETSALSEISTLATAAATGNDVYENELPTVTDAANVRVLQSSGDAAQMTMQSLATKLGELIGTATKEKKGLVAPDMFSFTRSATDANGCSVFGSYRLSPGVLNAPDGIKYGDVLFAVPWDANTIHQFIYTISGGTYRRVGGRENWSEWVKD